MALAVYTPDFSGSPCNREWYNNLNDIEFNMQQQCTMMFLEPSPAELSNGLVTTSMRYGKRKLLVTNLPTTNSTTVRAGDSNDMIDIPVFKIISFNMTEEIDPTGIRVPIPSATVKFLPNDSDNFESSSTIDAFLEQLRGYWFTAYKGWFGYNREASEFIDENGLPAVPYINTASAGNSPRFTHDINMLATFQVTRATFDFQSQEIIVEGESLGHYRFNQPWYLRSFLSKNLGHPTAIGTTSSSSSLSRGNLLADTNVMQLGFDPRTFVLGTVLSTDESTVSPSIDLYDHPHRDYTTYGISFASSQIGVQQNAQAPTRAMSFVGTDRAGYNYSGDWKYIKYWNNTNLVAGAQYFCNMSEYRVYSNYTTSVVYPDVYRMCPLCHNVNRDETFMSYFRTFMITNDLWLLPVNATINSIGWAIEVDNVNPRLGYDSGGSYRLVCGKFPDDRTFRDTSIAWDSAWASSDNYSNGQWYPTLSNRYYVTPHMLRQASVSREDASYDTYDYVECEYYNVYDDSGVNYDEYTIPSYPVTTTTSGLLTNSEFPARVQGQNIRTRAPRVSGVDFVTVGTIPLNNNAWYNPTMPMLISKGDSVDDMEYYPTSVRYTGQTYHGCIPWFQGKLKIWSWLFSSYLTYLEPTNPYPYTLKLPKQDATKYIRDINDNIISDNDISPENVVSDIKHLYYGHTGVNKRILDRVNYKNIPFKAKLTWKMVDDPSLRPGSVVYVPLYGEYTKCFLFKKTVAFSGGSTAECEAILMDATGEAVFDINIYNARGRYPIGVDDPTITFNWLVNSSVATNSQIQYTIFYRNGGVYTQLKTTSFIFMGDGEGYATSISLSEISDILGYTPELEGGDFYIQGKYDDGDITSDYAPVIMSGDSSDPYVIYSNQIEANNQPLPLMNGHWFIG